MKSSIYRFYPLLFVSLVMFGCAAAPPVIHSYSDDFIIIKYKAYGLQPTVTPKAKTLAIIHCRKNGKVAVYDGVTIPNIWTSSMEMHKFNCTEP